jgi:hypothetical protein
MSEYAALYCRNPPSVTTGWLAAHASGADVELVPAESFRGPRLVATWSDGCTLCLTSASSPEHERGTRDRMRADVDRGKGAIAPVLEQLAQGVGLFFVEAEPSFDERLMKVIRSIQTDLEALLAIGDRVESARGELLVSLPDEDDDEVPPPDAERVARRAMVLAAVVARSHLEQTEQAADDLEQLRRWVDRHQLWTEAELHERELLKAPIGQPAPQAAIDGSWRSEGLAVLLWALGICELPPHDEQADPNSLVHSAGLFRDDLPEPIAHPRLRSDAELTSLGLRLLGLHWRLRDFSLRPEAMDFVAFANDCWFGSFDIEGIPIAMKDLAIRGIPISSARPDDVRIAASIALERHQAINWLQGYAAVYSEVDTST